MFITIVLIKWTNIIRAVAATAATAATVAATKNALALARGKSKKSKIVKHFLLFWKYNLKKIQYLGNKKYSKIIKQFT